MKILLSGGHSSLAQVLRPVLESFAEVLTAGRNGCDVELDLTWPTERFELPPGLDAVIHLGAHFGGQDFDSMMAAEEVNVLGSLKLAHACTRAGVGHLVLVSSIFAELDEKSPFFNSYTLSKRHAEELTQQYCRNIGLPLAIVRPAQFYGEGASFRRHQPILYALLDRAQRGDEFALPLIWTGAAPRRSSTAPARPIVQIFKPFRSAWPQISLWNQPAHLGSGIAHGKVDDVMRLEQIARQFQAIAFRHPGIHSDVHSVRTALRRQSTAQIPARSNSAKPYGRRPPDYWVTASSTCSPDATVPAG